ncbi:hypothetical protein AGMMS49992_25560 [Clostridia bacterium]|nr:hypothetical protein AGMMS49992_25560 [Clostridia bacterium]
MNLLNEMVEALNALGIPVETGVFSETPPDTYAVITPLADTFPICADDTPEIDLQEARVSLFTKNNPRTLRNQIIRAFLAAGISITDRVYVGYEADVSLHHIAIDAEKQYLWRDQ